MAVQKDVDTKLVELEDEVRLAGLELLIKRWARLERRRFVLFRWIRIRMILRKIEFLYGA